MRLRHDEIGVDILIGSYGKRVKKEDQQQLLTCIRRDWSIEPEEVAALIGGRLDLYPKKRHGVFQALRHILDGPLDADKLDYLQRDSLHIGNPGGMGIDVDRFIDSLVVDSPLQGISLKERGLGAAQTMIKARYNMFLTVYWHKQNRAANRMFTGGLGYLRQHSPESFQALFEEDLFRLDDESLLRRVHDDLPKAVASDLIRPLIAVEGARHRLYKRVHTIPADYTSPKAPQKVVAHVHDKLCSMYDSFLRRDDSGWKWPYIEAAVTHLVSMEIGGDIQPYHILLDVPDARFEGPTKDDPEASLHRTSFVVHGSPGEKPAYVHQRAPDLGALLDSWRKNARKVRLFVAPDFAEAARKKKAELAEGLEAIIDRVWDAPTLEELDR
jgi:uncharacterized protein